MPASKLGLVSSESSGFWLSQKSFIWNLLQLSSASIRASTQAFCAKAKLGAPNKKNVMVN